MYLLDTHALLWALYEPEKLPAKTAKKIIDSDTVFASVASLWEIAIKQSIGKLEIDCPISTIATSVRAKRHRHFTYKNQAFGIAKSITANPSRPV